MYLEPKWLRYLTYPCKGSAVGRPPGPPHPDSRVGPVCLFLPCWYMLWGERLCTYPWAAVCHVAAEPPGGREMANISRADLLLVCSNAPGCGRHSQPTLEYSRTAVGISHHELRCPHGTPHLLAHHISCHIGKNRYYSCTKGMLLRRVGSFTDKNRYYTCTKGMPLW